VIHTIESIILACKFGQDFNLEFLNTSGFKTLAACINQISSQSGSSLGEFHATKEDGWRLLCNFGKVADVVMNKHYLGSHVCDINSFVSFAFDERASNCANLDSYLNYWELVESVAKEIAFKKTIEYFIHKSIPYNWATE